MKFRKRPSLTAREIRILALIGLVAVIAVSVLIGANIGLSRAVQGGGGFFVAWEGARAFLFQHIEPYSGTVAGSTQVLTYGRAAHTGENPYALTIPFFLLPAYFPFALFSDPATARGLWMFLSEAALVGTAFLSLRLIEWQPRRFFHAFYSLLSVFSFYSVASLLEGAPVIVLGLLYLGILSAYYMQQDELLGAFLVFSLFYWEIGSLFLILVIWKVFYEKRWRVLAGFGMTFFILLVLSFLLYPGWLLPFLTAVLAMMRSPFGIITAAVFAQLSPAYGTRIAQVLTVLLIVMLIYEWAATRDSDFRRFIWAAGLTLAATPLIGFRTEMSNLVVLFPALALIFAATTDRWRTGYWLTTLLVLLVLVLPWFLFARWFLYHDPRAYDYLFLIYPLFVIIGLYWTRWWFIRPPRTWMDHVRSSSG